MIQPFRFLNKNQLINKQIMLDGDPDDIRKIITNTVTTAVERSIDITLKDVVSAINGVKEKINEELKSSRNDLETMTNENKVIKKIISKQQEYLRRIYLFPRYTK